MNRPFALSRREALRSTALGFGSLALANLLHAADGATKAPHFAPRAKRVIFLFMKGGPSHIDTFEPKPQLDRDDGKPYPGTRPRVVFAKTGNLLKSPWKFKQYGQSGSPVSELFPHVAQCVDDICFVHSLHGTNPAHGGAALKLHTGSDSFVRPSMGAWIAYGLGTENADLPAFLTICPTLAHGGVNNWGSAFLPASTQGVPIGNASTPVEQAKVKYIANTNLPRGVQRKQLDLLKELNRSHLEAAGPEAALEGRIGAFELAYRMQTTMPEAEDITKETKETHKLYGLDDPITAPFGRQCLLARRFAERGVRFVQVTHSDGQVQWDQHGDLRKGHSKNAREVDRPIAGLLKDLKSRGLLKDTLVLWGGEFGRTPTVEGGGNDGRDHNPEGFTVWMAGGGVKPGFRYGATDDYGWYAAENKVHIHDLHATLLALLGLDHEKLTFKHAGRDFRLTDVAGRVVNKLFA
ncbi:MAG: DUF1501 domain-containing protein [Gemmataceae bacterium]|nr:DUF1501 domain-containing protein [Planctomycetia bacterium]MBX3401589.1 DUF1501 domain-containing protein [Gemmataceae bacterium]